LKEFQSNVSVEMKLKERLTRNWGQDYCVE
jgi:hypothetical protein